MKNAVGMKSAEREAYEFLKSYHDDDQRFAEEWRAKGDPRWAQTVAFCRKLREECARVAEAVGQQTGAEDGEFYIARKIADAIRSAH